MRRSLLVAVLIFSAPGAIAQTTAPPLCAQGTWPVRSSHNASGWQCTNQTTSGDQSSDSSSSSTTGGRRRGSGGGGVGGGYDGSQE
jgi:hypothetical protein